MANQSRRRFLTASAAAATAGGAACFAEPTPPSGLQQHYEWRTYRCGEASQRTRVLRYLESATVPAWRRLAIGPVGVFTEVDDASLDVHVLLSFDRPEQFLSERTALEQDDTYRRAAEEHLAAAKRDPAFARIDSTLMIAFAGQPRLSVPTNRPRVLELRTYKSHSEAKARRKVEMFNEGEIPIFLKAGFETVFFGEALCGAGLPQLKYLVASDSMRANKANWAAFRKHPDWRAMKNLPRYADTVSNIDKLFLEPTGFSEV